MSTLRSIAGAVAGVTGMASLWIDWIGYVAVVSVGVWLAACFIIVNRKIDEITREK